MSEKAIGADNQQATLQCGGASETTREISQARELAILLGMLFTDGCVSPKHKSSWRLIFCNKSKVLIDLFQGVIVKVFKLDQTRLKLSKQQLLELIIDSYHKPSTIYNLPVFNSR